MENKKTKKFRKIAVLAAIAAVLFAAAYFARANPAATRLLWNLSQGGKLLMPLVLVSALIDSINPCAFSVLLLTIAFLFSIGKMRSGILKIGGVYIFGVFIIYILIGLGILQTLHLFNTPHFMAKVGASLLILMGLVGLVNEFFPKFPLKLKIPKASHRTLAALMERGSMPTAFLLGALVGLCEFPCTGGPYLMILGLLHDKGTYLNGLGYLFLYNLIFVLPLVIILLMAGDRNLFEKVEIWKRKNTRGMRLYGGIATIIIGLLIFFL